MGQKETNSNQVHMCLEMMGDYGVLKAFYKKESKLLREAIVIFHQVEGWEVPAFQNAMDSKTDLVSETRKLISQHGTDTD